MIPLLALLSQKHAGLIYLGVLLSDGLGMLLIAINLISTRKKGGKETRRE